MQFAASPTVKLFAPAKTPTLAAHLNVVRSVRKILTAHPTKLASIANAKIQ